VTWGEFSLPFLGCGKLLYVVIRQLAFMCIS